MKKNLLVFLVLMIAILLAASCAPAAAPEPTAAASPLPPSQTLPPSETPSPVPTATVTPSPSPLPSKTFTPSSTATLAVEFSQAEVISYSEEPGSNLLILKVPGVKSDFKLKVDNFDYRCYFDNLYADRLFCRGRNRPTFSKEIKFVFYDITTSQEVNSSILVITVKPTLLPVVYDSAHNCADRGTNLVSEWECRINPDTGNPCVAATVFDACGVYFSVHSCPSEMDMNFLSCNDAQWAIQKALYGLP